MNPATAIRYWYRRSTDRPLERTDPYTPAEVRALLAPPTPIASQTRAGPVQTVASRPVDWLPRLKSQERLQIGGLADRLPMLVFLYSQGTSPEEMRERYGGLTAWRYERALEIACAGIADHLNRDR
ncbi:MAG: hypothetical protein IT305_11145 [Chloroflexi bacterium]|nr:hypothetical protein [Chloroflexota bacterium]